MEIKGDEVVIGSSKQNILEAFTAAMPTIEPFRFTKETKPNFSDCAQRRYPSEDFKGYRERLKRQKKDIKKYLRGMVRWDTEKQGRYVRNRGELEQAEA